MQIADTANNEFNILRNAVLEYMEYDIPTSVRQQDVFAPIGDQIKIFIYACTHFRSYALYPVLFAFRNNKVYSVIMLFDMIRCSIHKNTAFSLITALYKSLTQDTRFLCSHLCATCVLCVCYAPKFCTFYHNFRKHRHKENP